MPLTCSICKHPERAAIETAHVEGASLRDIAKVHPGITIWSLSRHFKHLPALIEKTIEQSVRNQVSGKLPMRIEQLIREAEAIAKAAKKKRSYGTVLQAIKTRLECLTMIAKLTGELRPNALGEYVPGTTAPGTMAAAQVTVNMGAASAEVDMPASRQKNPRELYDLLEDIYGLARTKGQTPPIM
ncbi:MAG TPA: hypothetical protein VNY51_09360 [Candidatus Dormibacteraeota bacterium]|jgi:hypothetical protein|nr:hypothetical protein [Candidatus Dormibacteraeota bacterium]